MGNRGQHFSIKKNKSKCMPCQATTNMSAQLGVCKNVKSKCEKQPVFLTYGAHYRPDLSGRSS